MMTEEHKNCIHDVQCALVLADLMYNRETERTGVKSSNREILMRAKKALQAIVDEFENEELDSSR